MKRVCEFILCFVSAVIILLGLAFAIIELRLIFSGDWLLYNSAAVGLIQYLIRFIMSLVLMATGVLTIVFRKSTSSIALYVSPAIMMSAIVITFSITPIDLVFAGISFVYYMSFIANTTLQSKQFYSKNT
jgi:hypothetical protein